MSKKRLEKSVMARIPKSISKRIDEVLRSASQFRSKTHFIEHACEVLLDEIEHRKGTK